MAMFALASASGAPGVTSTALALASCWPRPVVLVEADPSGSSALLAGFWRGTKNHPGVLDLVKAQRAGVLADAVLRMAVPVEGTQVSVIVGSRSHEQAAGLARLWAPLAGVLRDVSARDSDVIVDAGRLGLEGSPAPLLEQSDVTLLLVGSDLPAVAASMSWASSLGEAALPGHEARLLVIGAGRPYTAGKVAQALGLPVAASIVWDPARAAVFSHGVKPPRARGLRNLLGGADAARRAFSASAYQRSVEAAGEALRSIEERSARERTRWAVPSQIGEETGDERA